MTETTDLLNSGEDVILSQVWTLAHIGPSQKGSFSRWAKARARKELDDQLKDAIIDKATYSRDLRELSDRFVAGDYNWGSMLSDEDQGDAIKALLQSSDGLCRLAQLLLEPRHGAVSGKQVFDLLEEAQAQKPPDAPDDWQNPLSAAIARCLSPNRQAPAKVGAMTMTAKTTEIPPAGTQTAA